ncbi:L,D-transpeptidase family protein [Streptomyces sp. NPDC002588]|uniref:L,D-transpeptidase family protein n=1 Tax=Streptomyces sp. NPDC002588 TaxID=3154419 RepID=UPI0033226333
MITHRPHAVLLAASLLLLTGCGGGVAASTGPTHPANSTNPTNSTTTIQAGVPAPSDAALPTRIPGLGPKTRAAVPADARQVVVVTGRGSNSNVSSVVLYQRTAAGWQAGTPWPARNALNGWSDQHMSGDLHSPVGVYGLTDAGGLLPDPGTKLPYDQNSGFQATGTGFEGESLAGTFDYVVAINYNRQPGTSPLDGTKPLGAGRGGGIWFHVDHGGPTHGCVSLSEAHMKELLRALDPTQHPVVVMGDGASLAR